MNYKFNSSVASLQPSAIREILKMTSKPGIISFSAGNPSADAFPSKEIADIASDILRNDPVSALQYSITEGYPPLIEYLKQYMKGKSALHDEDAVIVTSGAQQVMALASKALCNSGDTIVCENPSFIGSLNSFCAHGGSLKGVNMQPDGMDMDALETLLKSDKKVKFIYTIPNFQNPTGITMSYEKRIRLYELACKYDVIILEDNPYGDIRFEGEDIPPIKSLDNEGRVIYAGSFSKVISPGMRVGFGAANKDLMAKMVVCKQVEDVHTNILSQMIIHRYVTEYDFSAHLERIREIYRHKAALMMSLADKYLCPDIKYNRVQGGLFIWATLPDNVDMTNFCLRLVKNSVAVVPGNAFSVEENAQSQSFRMNYSTETDENIAKGMQIIGETFKSCRDI